MRAARARYPYVDRALIDATTVKFHAEATA